MSVSPRSKSRVKHTGQSVTLSFTNAHTAADLLRQAIVPYPLAAECTQPELDDSAEGRAAEAACRSLTMNIRSLLGPRFLR